MKRKSPYPGVTGAPDRHGKRRWRFRSRRGMAGRIDCYLPGDFGSPEFVTAYELAMKGVRPDGRKVGKQAKPDTFDWLSQSYRQSAKFQNLASITKKNLNHEIEWLRIEVGDLPFARFELQHVEALMAKKKDWPTAANKIKKLLSRLFNHAIRLRHISINPAQLAERYKENPDGYHTWTDTEDEKFKAHWPEGSMPRLALALMQNTGAARQDLARLGWQNINEGRIAYKRGKTNISANLPILPELATELKHVPRGQLLFLTHTGGRGYTPESLGNWFKDRCRDAGIPHGNIHSVRKGTATRLAEAEATENEIAAMLAHSDTRQAATYTKKANRSRLADTGFAKLERAKRESNVSNLPKRLDK